MSAAKAAVARKVAVAELVLEERCQSREQINLEAIDEYAAAYSAGAELPPLAVYMIDGRPVVVDGYHRAPAAIKAGLEWLRVIVVGTGDLDEAEWYSTGVNKEHGVRRTNADKRRAVLKALRNPIGQEQSTRTIADQCGVSHQFVADEREKWEAAQQVSAVDTSAVSRRKGKDGKSYPAKRARAQVSAVDTSAPAPTEPEKTDEPLPFEPPELASAMPQYGGELRESAAAIRLLRLETLRKLPDLPALTGVRQQVETSMKAAEASLRLADPIVCSKCNGAGCARCGKQGWLTRLAAGER